MARWIAKPSRKKPGTFVVLDLAVTRGYVIADDVSEAVAKRMVRELNGVFA